MPRISSQRLKLYLLTQSEVKGWDTYSAIVVARYSSHEARRTNPKGELHVEGKEEYPSGMTWSDHSWASHPSKVTCKYLGMASDTARLKPGIVLTSFHAG